MKKRFPENRVIFNAAIVVIIFTVTIIQNTLESNHTLTTEIKELRMNYESLKHDLASLSDENDKLKLENVYINNALTSVSDELTLINSSLNDFESTAGKLLREKTDKIIRQKNDLIEKLAIGLSKNQVLSILGDEYIEVINTEDSEMPLWRFDYIKEDYYNNDDKYGILDIEGMMNGDVS